jgi:tricorn protease
MKINKTLFASVFLLLSVAASADNKLLRHPSYHKGKVAFSYLGDIWVAAEDGSGVARLTDHKARDIYPRFSPDGAWIAFSSNRAGNYDVFVVPATGGKPRQLTYHTADDTVVGWSTDSKRVLFQSTRGMGVFPSVATMFEVAVEGGLEQPIKTDWGYSGSYSADGSKLAFTRHPAVWSRKHYRGSYAADLWTMDVKAQNFTKLGDANYKGNYLWPMYGVKGDIYFVSDRLANEKNIQFAGAEVMKSVNNIWKISERGGNPVQVTKHTSGNLYFPSISADGRVIVYEENFGLWKLDTASGKSSQINVQITTDEKENALELLTVASEAESFSLSPSGKRAAISTHGEIFTVATDRGEVQRVTETFWRETDPAWSPNGKWIAFLSDRGGREELYIANERATELKKLSDNDTDKVSLQWAPDSKSILYGSTDHKVRRVDVESGQTEVVAESTNGNVVDAQFSPDMKWISYAKPDRFSRTQIFIKSLADGVEHKIGGEEILTSRSARWTPDGRKLVFLGGISAPSIASTGGRPAMQLYSVSLTRVEKNPLERDVDLEEDAPAATAGPRAPVARRDVTVKIEFDGLDRRVHQLTRSGDSVGAIAVSPDSRTYAYVSTGETDGRFSAALYTIQEDGERMTRVASAATADAAAAPRGRGGFGGGAISQIQWARDGASIYFMQGRGIYSAAVAGGGAGAAAAVGGGRRPAAPTATPSASSESSARRIAFTARLELDHAAERKQVFIEAWRVMKNQFYDAKMHGVNWASMRDSYEHLLADIGDSDELRTVIMQMIGELNASHTGVTAPPAREGEQLSTRYPGFDLEPDASGLFKVSYIYKKGPADFEYVKLAHGNFILAINGKDLKSTDNYWKQFNLIPGRKFEFLVNSKPSKEGAWAVKLDPLSGPAFADLQYAKWVDERKAMVTNLSKGDIGYLHIRAMDAPSLRKFERDLLENQGKKALVIDQRFNGGGGIDQELLQILNQHKYQSTRNRDSVEIQRPARAFFGPMVVMQNERSASDAEMFPDGFRALGLGKLVGVPTYGAVIGTGAYRLLDGSSIRTPGAGVYTAKGENMENYGVQPDIYVDNTPESFLAGRDLQIEKAVEELLSQIK